MDISRCLHLNQHHHGVLEMPFLNDVARVCVNSATLNFNWCKDINKLQSYMPNTHSTIASSSTNKTPSGSHFLNIILSMRWSNRLVKGMFQYQLTFFNNINLLSIVSMASSKSSVFQLPLGPVSYLITFIDLFGGYDSSWGGIFSLLNTN